MPWPRTNHLWATWRASSASKKPRRPKTPSRPRRSRTSKFRGATTRLLLQPRKPRNRMRRPTPPTIPSHPLNNGSRKSSRKKTRSPRCKVRSTKSMPRSGLLRPTALRIASPGTSVKNKSNSNDHTSAAFAHLLRWMGEVARLVTTSPIPNARPGRSSAGYFPQ